MQFRDAANPLAHQAVTFAGREQFSSLAKHEIHVEILKHWDGLGVL
jgi:hypothetical protein